VSAASSSKPAPWALGVAVGRGGAFPFPHFTSPQEGAAALSALKHMRIVQYQIGQTQGGSNRGHAVRPELEMSPRQLKTIKTSGFYWFKPQMATYFALAGEAR
jgi:hypothetical protein